MSSQEGGWLSHTYYNNKLCMKSAKTEFKYLPFFDNITHGFTYSLKKYHHNANPPPAFVQTDGGSTIAKKKCQAPPLEDFTSCGDAGGVNDPVQ